MDIQNAAENAESAKSYSEQAQSALEQVQFYSETVMPNVGYDTDTGTIYQTGGKNYAFGIDEDTGTLYGMFS